MPGKKLGVTVLVSSQTAVKDGHGFEIAVRMDKLRGGDCGEIQRGDEWSMKIFNCSQNFTFARFARKI